MVACAPTVNAVVSVMARRPELLSLAQSGLLFCGLTVSSGLNRIQPLIKVGAVPYQDKEKADAGLSRARSTVADAEARLEAASRQLDVERWVASNRPPRESKS